MERPDLLSRLELEKSDQQMLEEIQREPGEIE
jgi:hypothetical protein